MLMLELGNGSNAEARLGWRPIASDEGKVSFAGSRCELVWTVKNLSRRDAQAMRPGASARAGAANGFRAGIRHAAETGGPPLARTLAPVLAAQEGWAK